MSSITAKALINPDTTWEEFLKSIATGATVPESLLAVKLTSREAEALMLSNPAEAKRWREARMLGKASKFSLLQRDEIFRRIARDTPVETALAEVRGPETAEEDVADFFELIEALPDWAEQFAGAMRAKGLRQQQKALEIVDCEAKDIISGPKGDIPNMAAVNRSRLRWEARAYLWSKWDPDRFGDRKPGVQVNVQINHAERLTRAYANEKRRGAPQQETPRVAAPRREAVDATFTDEPAVEPEHLAEAMRTAAAADPAIEVECVADALRSAAAADPALEPEQAADAMRAAAVVESAALDTWEDEPADSSCLDD